MIDEEKIRSEFNEIYDKSPAFNDIESKKQIADYWIEKIKQSNLALLEELEGETREMIEEALKMFDYKAHSAFENVLSTLSKHKERLSEK
jgi:hypothetical protein